MAPPINVQDWYGDRHTCQIASGALGQLNMIFEISDSEAGLKEEIQGMLLEKVNVEMLM